jgi:hypothetical protein
VWLRAAQRRFRRLSSFPSRRLSASRDRTSRLACQLIAPRSRVRRHAAAHRRWCMSASAAQPRRQHLGP